MRFVCDFDGIAYPFVTGVSTHPRGQGLTIENCAEWETPIEVTGLEHWPAALAHALSYETMCAVGLYEDFPPAMEDLKAWGIEPLVQTHRPAADVAAVRRVLEEEGLGWLSVTQATPEEKIAFCLREGISVIVDDHPQTIIDAHQAGLTVLSLRFPYNAAVIEQLGVTNAPDWEALKTLLRDTLA
jgi:hypothetical protein